MNKTTETAREARERRERLAQRAHEEAAERTVYDHPLNCTCFACCAVRAGYGPSGG